MYNVVRSHNFRKKKKLVLICGIWLTIYEYILTNVHEGTV